MPRCWPSGTSSHGPALGAGYLWLGYRVGGEEERRRSFWIMEAALVFVSIEVLQLAVWALSALGLFALDVPTWMIWLDIVETSVVLACLFFAIFRAGAFNSELVLTRTAAVSASSGLALLLFVALEETVMEFGSDALGVETRIGSILSGVIAAFVFQFVARRFSRFLTRNKRRPPTSDEDHAADETTGPGDRVGV